MNKLISTKNRYKEVFISLISPSETEKSENIYYWPKKFLIYIAGIDASQPYPYSMCQPVPTGLYTRLEYDSETKRLTARQNKSRSFENMVLSYFQKVDQISKLRVMLLLVDKKN